MTNSFWAEFRHTVKQANPEAYLLGEIWTVDPRWVGPRTFDGLMNYPMRKSLLDLVVDGSLTPSAFRLELEGQIGAYPEANVLAQYNLLGSHDTERVATLAHQDARRLRLLSCLQFLLPGAPGIYYGDEIGLTGGKDPASRGAFPWDPAAWDTSRRDLLRRLIQLRKTRPEIRRGRLEFLVADDDARILAFARRWEDQSAVCHCEPVGGDTGSPVARRRPGLAARTGGTRRPFRPPVRRQPGGARACAGALGCCAPRGVRAQGKRGGT